MLILSNQRGIVLFLVISLLLVTRESTLAVEVRLVKIEPLGEDKLVGFLLDQPVLQVEKNTIIIWLSFVRGMDIQVIFREEKTCNDVTDNQKAFLLNEKGGCYVTSFMGFGETSSLEFIESGTYIYYIVTASGNIRVKGSVVVR